MTLIFSIRRHLRFAIATRQIVDRLCLWVKSEFHMMQVVAQDRAHLACALEHRLIAPVEMSDGSWRGLSAGQLNCPTHDVAKYEPALATMFNTAASVKNHGRIACVINHPLSSKTCLSGLIEEG